MTMKRVGILLLLAALAAPAQMRSMGGQRGPVSTSAPGGAGRGAGFSGSLRSTAPNWPNGGWHRGTGEWHGNNYGGGVRVGNWTFRTGPTQRGCPGFNCVSYPYYPSYYPVYSIPYVPTYAFGLQTQPAPAPEPQYVYADNGASQSSSYDAGYAAAMAQVATSAVQQSRYGDHYLDSRERAVAPAEAAPSVSVTQGPAAASSRNYTSQGPASISPATVLIFKDGHTSEIHNYAIIGQTLWNLSETQARKIPLTDLDLDATVRANDDRGMTFKVPGSHD
jgi:hypothetical protein